MGCITRHRLVCFQTLVTLFASEACGTREITVLITPTPTMTPQLAVLNEYVWSFNAEDVQGTWVHSDDVVVSFGPVPPQSRLNIRNRMVEVLEDLDNRGQFTLTDLPEI